MKTNNTKKFTSTLVALVLALGIVSAINYVSASYGPTTFTFPNCPTTEPACNTPINVGTTAQTKNSDLYINGVNNIIASTGISTKSFLASGNSEFQQGVTVDQLKNSVDHTVCVDPNGKLVLCNTPGSVRISPSYTQTFAVTGISGYTQSPSPTGNTVTGTHTAFTGPISVAVTTTAPQANAGVLLMRNGVTLDCLYPNFPTSSTNSYYSASVTFSSYSYSLADSIEVDSVTGVSSCH